MELKPQSTDIPWRQHVTMDGVKLVKGWIDGWYREWDEFVPSGYKEGEKLPLVIVVHGGAWATMEKSTAWEMVAERENFIVVYPHSLRDSIMFNLWRDYDSDGDMPDDIKFFDGLIDLLEKKYSIDEERIYMCGQSNGDMMTSTYIFERGNRLAAAAPLSGPAGVYRFVDEKGDIVRGPKYPLPVIRTHGSLDVNGPMCARNGKTCTNHPVNPNGDPRIPTEEERFVKFNCHQRFHIAAWSKLNGCKPMKISMRGRYSWLRYDGDPCDFIFYMVENGQHGPYMDMADNIWTYFFSGYKRVNGEVVKMQPDGEVPVDEGAIALADGATLALINNETVEVGAATRFVKNVPFVPVAFLERAFPGVSVEVYADGLAARIRWTGADKKAHLLQTASGNRAVVLDEHLVDCERTFEENGIFYVPIGDYAELMFGWKLAVGRDAAYINQFGGEMGYDLAYIIRVTLGAQRNLSWLECRELEIAERAKRKKDPAKDQATFEEFMKGYRADAEAHPQG